MPEACCTEILSRTTSSWDGAASRSCCTSWTLGLPSSTATGRGESCRAANASAGQA